MRQLQFRDPLGAGAFGTVYRADLISKREFRRPVAVKVLNVTAGPEGERVVGRIRDEARLLGLLQDDSILKVIDLVRVAGREAVVMEYVEGVDLSKLLPHSQPPPRALAEMGAILSGALHRAHTARHPETGEPLRVVHRDVKPQNVMLTIRGGVKLLDFGVAKAAFDARESRTGQLMLGTLHYMAHDYILTGQVSPALDLYGLGLVLLECTTGERFGRPLLNEAKFTARREELLATVPAPYAPLLPVLRRALAWDPVQRGDARGLEQELLRIADDVSGRGLRRWCAQVVEAARDSQDEAEDLLALCGKTITIDENPSVPEPPTRSLDAEPTAPGGVAGGWNAEGRAEELASPGRPLEANPALVPSLTQPSASTAAEVVEEPTIPAIEEPPPFVSPVRPNAARPNAARPDAARPEIALSPETRREERPPMTTQAMLKASLSGRSSSGAGLGAARGPAASESEAPSPRAPAFGGAVGAGLTPVRTVTPRAPTDPPQAPPDTGVMRLTPPREQPLPRPPTPLPRPPQQAQLSQQPQPPQQQPPRAQQPPPKAEGRRPMTPIVMGLVAGGGLGLLVLVLLVFARDYLR